MKHLFVLMALLPSLAHAQTADPGLHRCVNLGDGLESPNFEGEWSYTIEARDLDLIADAGFDSIRLPVRFSAHWDGTQFDPDFLARVDEVIKMGLDRNLKVILDLHHFDELMTDPDSHVDAFIAMWASLGDHYAGWPDDLYFDLLNEPTHDLTTARVIPLYQQVIAALRPAHPTRWIIVEGGNWANYETLADLPDFGPYTLPSFHYYDPYTFTHQQLPWDDDPLPDRSWSRDWGQADIDAHFDAITALGRPVFLGEFGTYREIDETSRLAWLSGVRTAAERRGIGWCAWSLSSNFAILTEDKSDWLPGVLPALGMKDWD